MAAEIKNALGIEPQLTPGDKGAFDVVVNGKTIYSKKVTNRFPNENEVASLLKN